MPTDTKTALDNLLLDISPSFQPPRLDSNVAMYRLACILKETREQLGLNTVAGHELFAVDLRRVLGLPSDDAAGWQGLLAMVAEQRRELATINEVLRGFSFASEHPHEVVQRLVTARRMMQERCEQLEIRKADLEGILKLAHSALGRFAQGGA